MLSINTVFYKSYSGLCVLAFLAFFNTKISAQKVFTLSSEDIEQQELSLNELLNVNTVTASNSVQKLIDAPATIISISSNEIEKFGWRDLKDMLRSLPGIDISYNVEGEIQSIVTMRGVQGNNKILILQDGKRQNPITGERIVFGHNMPLFLCKKIEIVYGPASAIYGADAYAGVINLITKDGGDLDGMQAELGYIDSKAMQGTFAFGQNFGEEIDIVLGARFISGQDVELQKDYQEYDGINNYEQNISTLNVKYPINNWNIFAKLKYKRLKIGFDWQKQLETNAYSTNPEQFAYVEDNLWGQSIRHLNADYEIINQPGKIYWTATASLGDYEVNPVSNRYEFTTRDLTEAKPQYTYSFSQYLTLGTQVNIKLNPKLNLVGGTTYTTVKSFPKTKSLDTPFNTQNDFEDDLSAFKDFNGYVYGLIGLVDSVFVPRDFYTVGYFVQTDWAIRKNLNLTTGLRFDFNSIFGSTINPRIGLVYKPSTKLNLKLLGGSAFIAPSNSFRWENRAESFLLHVPNFNIQPERLVNLELSTNWFVTDNIALRLSVFRNTMNDVIRVGDAPVQEGNYPYYNPLLISGEPIVETNLNVGKTYSQGIELDATFRQKSFLGTLRYSYLTGDDNGNVLPKVSPHKVVLNTAYTHKRFTLAFTLRAASGIQTTATNAYYGSLEAGGDNSFKFDGHAIAYTNLQFKLTATTKFVCAIDNIFNTKHFGASPGLERGRLIPRVPQPLRKIYIGLSVRY